MVDEWRWRLGHQTGEITQPEGSKALGFGLTKKNNSITTHLEQRERKDGNGMFFYQSV
jgi:hypothetical protein